MLQLAIGSLALQVPASTVTKGSPLVAGTTGLVVPTAQFAKPEACAMDGGRITGTAVRMDQYNGMVVPVEGKPTGLPGRASLGDSAKLDPAGSAPGVPALWWPHHGHRPPHGPVQWPRLHDDGGDGGPSGPDGEPRRQNRIAPDALRAEACQLSGGRITGTVRRMDQYNGLDCTTTEVTEGLAGPMASLGDSIDVDAAALRPEACQLSGGESRITGTVRRMDQYNGLDCTTTEATEGLPGPMASLGDKAKFAPDALRAEACQLGGGRPSGWVVRMDPYNGMDMTTDAFPRE